MEPLSAVAPQSLPWLPKKPQCRSAARQGLDSTACAFLVTGQATGDPDALCFFICFSRPGRVRLSFQPTCVCALVCVRLLEENRTVVSDLHYGRRTQVACLTTLCEMIVL